MWIPRIGEEVRVTEHCERDTLEGRMWVHGLRVIRAGVEVTVSDCQPGTEEARNKWIWDDLLVGVYPGRDDLAPVETSDTPAPDGVQSEYPLTGRVYWRGNTNEWVLELNGSINDVSFSCRHPQPAEIAPEDVPGLPSLYTPASLESGDGVQQSDATKRMVETLGAEFQAMTNWTRTSGDALATKLRKQADADRRGYPLYHRMNACLLTEAADALSAKDAENAALREWKRETEERIRQQVWGAVDEIAALKVEVERLRDALQQVGEEIHEKPSTYSVQGGPVFWLLSDTAVAKIRALTQPTQETDK